MPDEDQRVTPAVAGAAGVDRPGSVRHDAVRATPGLAVEFIDRPERLEALAGEIDALMARTGAPASSSWPALRAGMANDPESRIWAVVVRRAEAAVGAALFTLQQRVGMWVLRSMTQSDQEGWLAAVDDVAADALGQAVAEGLRELHLPWRMELRLMPADDPVLASLVRAMPTSHLQPFTSVARLACDAASPLASCLSYNTRVAVARARKRIAAAGLSLGIHWTREREQIDAALDEVIDLRCRRDVQLRGVALLHDPQERAVFENTVRGHAAAGRTRLLTLRLDGALAAFAVCFEASGRLHVNSNMAAPSWLQYSPGTIANAEVVAAAHRDPGVRDIDWGPGLQRYKLSGEYVQVDQLVNFHAWSSAGCRLAWTLYDRMARR